MPTRLIELVEKLPSARVLLVGDLMLDRYIYGNAERLSPEAPVPVLHYQHEDYRIGGAGSVAADLSALGAKVTPVGLIGQDDHGRQLKQLLGQWGVNLGSLIETSDRPTICKTRLVGLAQHRHPQQMIRLDFENSAPIDDALVERVWSVIEKAITQTDAVCIEDYNKGLVRADLCRRLIALARNRKIPVFVDPAPISDYSKYTGASAITPNRAETLKASGLPVETHEQFQQAGKWLVEKLNLDAAIITLDKHGAYLSTRDGQEQWLKTRQRTVYDVTGAGDMVLAMITAARCGGANWEQSVALANIAGGLEVERFGSVPVTRQEIIQELLQEEHNRSGKQRSLDQLLVELAGHRAAGKKIVFTNGCFDLLHLGHIKYFQFAKSQGDILVVGINTDASIRKLKGDKRPIIPEQDRLCVLEELESIDYLVTFDQDTPADLIQAVRPDVLVKGADYTKETVVGADFVESYGGKLALAPLIDGRSTSALIRRILEAYSP